MADITLNIRNAIQERGLKQKAIAERIGMDEKMFSNLLAGRKMMLADYVPKIAAALGVAPNELYGIEHSDT